MDSGFALGVDIGGTHIAAAIVNTENGALLSHTQYRSAINSNGNANEIIDTCVSAIRQSWINGGFSNSPVGIAMPGPFDYENGICLIAKQEKYQALYGMNMKDLLAAQLGIQPENIRFMNDASGFLKGELVAGELKGEQEAVGITLGTGLGSAYYKNHLLKDAELWRLPFKTGIAEDYLSTRWFITEYKLKYNKAIQGVKDLMMEEVDPGQRADLFDRFAVNLANFIELLSSSLNCNNVVIGGNIAKASPYFWDKTCKVLQENNCLTKLSIALLGESAAIIGAASLYQSEKVQKIKF